MAKKYTRVAMNRALNLEKDLNSAYESERQSGGKQGHLN
jgi:hypothetical protein